jgi:hypothetical protein
VSILLALQVSAATIAAGAVAVADHCGRSRFERQKYLFKEVHALPSSVGAEDVNNMEPFQSKRRFTGERGDEGRRGGKDGKRGEERGREGKRGEERGREGRSVQCTHSRLELSRAHLEHRLIFEWNFE